jgi:hypothetical protein
MTVQIDLDQDQALVLFELLQALSPEPAEADAIIVDHVVCSLEAQLSEPFQADYQARLKSARRRLLDGSA